MKNTGIVRKVDELGRIVLPIELRRTLGIEERDALEIYVSDGTIVMKKHTQNCIFCGSNEELDEFMGKQVCKSCRAKLSE